MTSLSNLTVAGTYSFKIPFPADCHVISLIKNHIMPGYLNYTLDSRKVKKLNYSQHTKHSQVFPDLYKPPGGPPPPLGHTPQFFTGRTEFRFPAHTVNGTPAGLRFPVAAMQLGLQSLWLRQWLTPLSLSCPGWLSRQLQQPLTQQGIVSLQVHDYVPLLFNNLF